MAEGRGGNHEATHHEATQRAFLEAAMPHLDAIYRVARHATSDPFAAEDLVQETYLRAYAGFSGHRGPSTRAWLVTICLNLARSQWRQRARRPSNEPIEAAAPRLVELSSPDPVDVVQARLDQEAVSGALAELPEPQRVAIVLMDLVGHSASEVAALLDCPRGTVLARAHRGRRRLAQLLQERGYHHDPR